MLDKSVPYYNIIMKRDVNTHIPSYELPDGYSFVSYTKGYEVEWVDIEKSVLEFDSIEEGLDYFNKNYKPHIEEVEKRMIFIEDEEGSKVATLTIWWEYIDGKKVHALHWVGVKKECQCMGLGKALVFKGLNMLCGMYGDTDIYLHTQTWSYTAVIIYMKAGFYITKDLAFDDSKNDYDKALEVLRDKVVGWDFT